MKRLLLFVAALLVSTAVQHGSAQSADLARWERQAANVTITRDDWGIAHVHGKTDADAVFGAIYAQAEDDFNRVETNFINSQGRLAEAEGEAEIWRDLRMKLFIDPADMKKQFAASPAWLQALMNAWADGLNYYLATHPQVKPRVITRFEPWMALTFSEGSIGGDIEKVNLSALAAFYGGVAREEREDTEPRGSNGAAVAPSNTTSKHALLLINPHTSFFFRSELQMTSDEGLNAYGASTWGQFFIYQGFNEHAGWMHTTSGVDATDEFIETVTLKDGRYFSKRGTAELPVTSSVITVPYKTATGMAEKSFTVYRTAHGPIVRSIGDRTAGQWVAYASMQEPVKALTQSYSRTKAANLAEFKKTMELHANSSNNTLFADSQGNVAYLHSNFIPRRNPKFDWTRPVDGSDPATDWGPLLSVDESPNVINPQSGWVYNSNNWPWSAAGPSSPKRGDFPVYVETGTMETPRGLHALRVFSNKRDFTLDGLVAAAYDSYQPWFEKPIPALVKAWDAAPAGALKTKLAEPIALLRAWDFRWSATSVPTSVAIYFGNAITPKVAADARRAGISTEEFIGTQAPAAMLLESLASGIDKLTADFGKWQTPWGDINRFQRLTDDLVHPFTDAGPSIPVAFSSATWGSLASFGARSYNGSKKIYGTSGNSFVAVVEFGPTVRARAVTAGGESGDPKSKHFNDQAERYATGNLREVYFYPAQLAGHTERVYKPGK
ncbi:MAG: acylase [Acidobacteria bacterium]|nr:MAG: acylase [Acidobacteriota bacterium]